MSRDAGPVKGGDSIIAFVDDPTGYKWEVIGSKGKPVPEPIAQVRCRTSCAAVLTQSPLQRGTQAEAILLVVIPCVSCILCGMEISASGFPSARKRVTCALACDRQVPTTRAQCRAGHAPRD